MLEGARIQHLFPGDELKFLTDPRAGTQFQAFASSSPCSCAPSPPASASLRTAHDGLVQVNYSSARAALIEVWRGIEKARSMVAMMFATPLLLAVTEDAIDAGLIDVPPAAPSLYEAPAAWLRGRWIGPARGWVDPVKEPAGNVAAIEAGSARSSAPPRTRAWTSSARSSPG
jgi:capsid protein